MKVHLNKEDIIAGLNRVDALARERGLLVELAVYGGAALSLVFNLREITRDVDVAVHGNSSFVREAASRVAEEMDWPEDWLNDGVKGFLSAQEDLEELPAFQGTGGVGLRVYVASARYLFAMKCMAMRPEGLEGAQDMSDIVQLAAVIGIDSPEQALDLIQDFYPAHLIPAKVAFGVEELLSAQPGPRPASGPCC